MKSCRYPRLQSRLVGCGAAAFLMICQNCGSKHSLTRASAAAVISGTPEFSRSRKLVSVDSLGCGRDSEAGLCYGDFTFEGLYNGRRQSVKGSGQFRYRDGKWRLSFFRYGEPPYIVVELE